MIDIIVILIILAIVGAAIGYIVKAKKKGAKCIGCPAAGCCSMKSSKDAAETDGMCCGCGLSQDEQEKSR